MDAPVIFSIIIPTYHRPKSVLALVEQLINQENTPGFEVIVVDDSALADLKAGIEGLDSRGIPVNYLVCAGEGPGRARNYGSQQARGDFLVFLDDDCQVSPRWLATLQKEIAASSAEIYYGPIDSNIHRYEPFIQTVEMEDCPYRSTNIAFDKRLFNELGGFDPNLSHWSEGWDLVSRARRHGAQLKYLPWWSCSHAPHYTRPQYFQINATIQSLGKINYLMTRHRDSTDIQNHLNSLFASGVWHAAARVAFFVFPLFFVSSMRSFLIFLLMNVAYDVMRLMFIQSRISKKQFGIGSLDALLYLAFNWSEDLRKALLRLALFIQRFRAKNNEIPFQPEEIPEMPSDESPAPVAVQSES